jgi:hypothetical protein
MKKGHEIWYLEHEEFLQGRHNKSVVEELGIS